MLFYLNLVFAWIAMISAAVLIVVFVLRVINKLRKTKWVARLNRVLRQNHKSLGVILILFGLAHGILSSDKAIGFNLGTLSWVLTILLGLSFVYRKRFKPQRLWMNVHRLLSVLFAMILVIHISDVGGFAIDDVLAGRLNPNTNMTAYALAQPEPKDTLLPSINPTHIAAVSPEPSDAPATPEPSPTPTNTPVYVPQIYNDGIYQGIGEGFRPGLTVEVEIKNDEIIRVEVISHNEAKQRYWGYPVENMPKWIVDDQSTDVDTVSGATYTSRGIIEAVDNALDKARIN